jgi:hypothetical protein
MPRYKDLQKDPTPYTDGELQSKLNHLEHELKGSVTHLVVAEPAVLQRPPELVISEELANLKAGLLEVKADLNHIKELIEKMQANGLKMKTQW